MIQGNKQTVIEAWNLIIYSLETIRKKYKNLDGKK